ncbi:MAG: TIGR03915 family putative DNA repair protein [Firmicutes bacterium]|nr:TIGR03915 family putative DNA repair protein [Bacillota bacterium]
MKDFAQSQICYTYDGSFYGMLSCVFASFEKKEIPMQITCARGSLFKTLFIETDPAKAERILRAIPLKIGDEALKYTKYAYLADMDEKEIALIWFLKEGFLHGRGFIETVRTRFSPQRSVVAGALKNPYVDKLRRGVDLLVVESARFIEFARFSDAGGALVSVIEPQNNVLPLLARHFTERYRNDNFMIYDKTHGLVLLYSDYKISIEPIEEYEMPPLCEEEKKYQKLWRLFYNTVEIAERHNPRCRMNHMPKKYWKNMTEFMSKV